jgi:hypothetical protein
MLNPGVKGELGRVRSFAAYRAVARAQGRYHEAPIEETAPVFV